MSIDLTRLMPAPWKVAVDRDWRAFAAILGTPVRRIRSRNLQHCQPKDLETHMIFTALVEADKWYSQHVENVEAKS